MSAVGEGEHAYNPYSRSCPSRRLLRELGELWSVLVIGALYEGPLRFTEISRRVDGISTKMLTQTLRTLERDGLVRREYYTETPPRVTYELTALGRDLADVMDTLENWAVGHMDDVLAAREAYDAERAD
ncbi:winged helix-turn-helix transcriptional regulator [Actinomyces succiniciruminis]|uniref:HxlR-like helix-turn-helix protein n=1 Tax=Actinomyces succiniciruminis TaxID=1522002 RepID=A0A1L7RP00_9ACTO|nr:helix-turn-helix domain-containing protein [Actinomyces succiniciruminis]CED90843.1 HxlR-like helix-turn-helix protein [Actinomyces succiniciruminis]